MQMLNFLKNKWFLWGRTRGGGGVTPPKPLRKKNTFILQKNKKKRKTIWTTKVQGGTGRGVPGPYFLCVFPHICWSFGFNSSDLGLQNVRTRDKSVSDSVRNQMLLFIHNGVKKGFLFKKNKTGDEGERWCK